MFSGGGTSEFEFDQRLSTVCGSIDDLENRVSSAVARAEASESEKQEHAARMQNSEAQMDLVLADFTNCLEQQETLQRQVTRLKAEVVASHVNNENELSQMVRLMEVSQTETAHLRARLTASELARERSELERDDARADLAGALADMHAMQGALLDSALYVRFLRARLVDYQIAAASDAANGPSASGRRAAGRTSEGQGDNNGTFSFERTKEAVQAAVAEAGKLPAADRAKRLKGLRLRWHPDKNPVLQEFATEVTKIINEAVELLPPPDADPPL